VQSDRSITQLTADIVSQAGDLLRHELRLARAELMQSVKHMGAGVVRAAMGVALAGSALTLALVAVAYGLSEMVPMWSAALISALIGASFAYLLIRSGLKAVSFDHITLPKTVEHVSRDLNLLKETDHEH